MYPAPVFVVGTYDPQGKPNVMTASWGGICCSRPVFYSKSGSQPEKLRKEAIFEQLCFWTSEM